MQAVVGLAARIAARAVDEQPGLHAGTLEPGRDRQGDARLVVLVRWYPVATIILVEKDREQPAGQDTDLKRLAQEVDPLDKIHEHGASLGRRGTAPAPGKIGGAGDVIGTLGIIRSPVSS